METNGFEKYMERKLKEREIAPSPEAWQRISEQLDAPGKSRTKTYLWFAVAASFTGILLFSIMFLKDNGHPNPGEVQVADTPGNVGKLPGPETLPETDLETGSAFEGNRSDPGKNADNDGLVPKGPELIDRSGQKTAIAQHQMDETPTEMHDADPDDLIDAKIAEMMNRANLMEADGSALSDAEVDSLLRTAQRELLASKAFNGNRSVDAMALLDEVETELDRTFRSQIFEALKDGFLKARTAVADRNK